VTDRQTDKHVVVWYLARILAGGQPGVDVGLNKKIFVLWNCVDISPISENVILRLCDSLTPEAG